MKQIRSLLILALAIIGVCAVVFYSWRSYQQHAAEEHERAVLLGPPQVPSMAPAPDSKPPPQ